MDAREIRGRCLCGAVGFTLTPPTSPASHCHCESCRRATGAAFVTWTSVPVDRFRYTAGEDVVRWHRSSPPIRWGFCGACGSTMLYVADGDGHPDNPRADSVYVTVASLVDPLDRPPGAHYSFEEHVAWFTPHDHLPRFEAKTARRLPGEAVHLILYVADQAASRAFYAAALDLEPRLDVPGMTEFALPGGTVLGLMPQAGIERLLDGRVTTGDAATARAELYLHVADVAVAHARALAAGAVELSPPATRDWGDVAAYSRDPDGHVLAFARSDG